MADRDTRSGPMAEQAVRIIVSIPAHDIPPNSDPILDLVPILEGSGYKLVQNGVAGSERFLAFERDVPVANVIELQPTCYGHCGFLGWTVRDHGRVTHKQSCPNRCEPWCQTHPAGCPPECEPVIWADWRDRTMEPIGYARDGFDV